MPDKRLLTHRQIMRAIELLGTRGIASAEARAQFIDVVAAACAIREFGGCSDAEPL